MITDFISWYYSLYKHLRRAHLALVRTNINFELSCRYTDICNQTQGIQPPIARTPRIAVWADIGGNVLY